MFNPYDDRPLISNREADLGDVEVDAPLSLQEIAKLVPVFFAAGRKQRAYQDGRGLQDVGTDKMLIGMHAVLVAEGRIEDANVLGKYVNWLRRPHTFDGLAAIEYKALSDPKVKAILRSIHGNRHAQELSRRAERKLVYRDARGAANYWNIRADEEATVGHIGPSMEFRKMANTRVGFDHIEPPTHPRLLDAEGQTSAKARRTRQGTIDANRFFEEFKSYTEHLNGRTWEQAEADFARNKLLTVKQLRSRIRRGELRKAGKK